MRSRILLWGGLALVLLISSGIVAMREMLLRDGQIMLLELAPRDPRSLMQGDYMTLRFSLANQIYARYQDDFPTELALVKLDEDHVATLIDLLPAPKPTTENTYVLQFQKRRNSVQISTNAYFFQEGLADQYAQARYGVFRVSPDGKALLSHLLDEKMQALP